MSCAKCGSCQRAVLAPGSPLTPPSERCATCAMYSPHLWRCNPPPGWRWWCQRTSGILLDKSATGGSSDIYGYFPCAIFGSSATFLEWVTMNDFCEPIRSTQFTPFDERLALSMPSSLFAGCSADSINVRMLPAGQIVSSKQGQIQKYSSFTCNLPHNYKGIMDSWS